MKGFLRDYLSFYPSDFIRLLVVLSLTDFLIGSPHFCAKTLAFRSFFTNFSKCRWSPDVVFGGLPLHFAVWTFPQSRYFPTIVAAVSLDRLVSSTIVEIASAPPFVIPTMKARSFL